MLCELRGYWFSLGRARGLTQSQVALGRLRPQPARCFPGQNPYSASVFLDLSELLQQVDFFHDSILQANSESSELSKTPPLGCPLTRTQSSSAARGLNCPGLQSIRLSSSGSESARTVARVSLPSHRARSG